VFPRPDLGESSVALVDAQEESVEVLQLDGNFEHTGIPGNAALIACFFWPMGIAPNKNCNFLLSLLLTGLILMKESS